MSETLISELIEYAVKKGLDKEIGMTTKPALGYKSLWWARNGVLTDEEVEKGLKGDPEASTKLINYVLWYIENYALASYALALRVAGNTQITKKMRNTIIYWIKHAQELAKKKDLQGLLDFANTLGLKPI